MSGEEVLLGIGLLCNAMQIITFGRDALQVFKRVRDGHSPDPNLDTYIKGATTSYETMQARIQSVHPTSLTEDQKELLVIGEKYKQRLEKLANKLDELTVPKDAKGVCATFSRVKTSFKSVWRPDELRDLEKDVSRHERLLQTKFLSNICTEGQATQIRASGGFDKLDRDLQHFVNQLLAGHRSLTELVSVESTHIKEHVSDQHNETRQAITSAIRSTGSDVQANISESASQIQDTIRLERRERDMTAQHIQLLASLRPLEANDRLNRIDDKETQTFDWILENPPFKSASHDSETTDNKELSRGDARERHASKFITWLQSDSKVFWLSGKPGCGKSTLMKYLFGHPKTVAYLNHWQDGTKILSHYFWKPGTELQHNLKGMLCSLSRQLLEDPLLATDLMRQNPDVAKKISFSDWSVTELKGVLLRLLAETKCAICIALDALDEVVQNDVAGPKGVLNLLDDVHKLKRVKVCASSRPEPEFVRYFSTHPQMHLHDLTSSDICLVAKQRLVGDIPSYKHMMDSLPSKIARQSEGIFLWAIIVIDLLNRGFRNKDQPGQLLERLHSFPKEIELLLWDMWNRLGHDSRIYQKEASLYLRLHMALRKLDDELGGSPHISNEQTSPDANSLLILAIASSDTVLHYNAERGGRMSKEDLQEHCQRTLDRIGVCCAGLISFKSMASTSTIGSDLDFATSPNLESSKFYVPSFTHRCVLDFLTDTEGGRQILESCPLDDHQLLIRGIKAFMRAGHFVPFVMPYSATRGLAPRWYHGKVQSCLWQTSLMIHLAQINADEKEACNGLLRKWQLEGLFQDSKYWRHPFPIVDARGRASLALEMSELTFLVSVDSVIQMRSELEGKDTDDFLALIPVIARSSRYPIPILSQGEREEKDKLMLEMRRLYIGMARRLASIADDHDETAGSLCQDWSGENPSLQSHPRQIAQMMLAHLFAWLGHSAWGHWFSETPIFDAFHQSWNCIPSIRAMCFPLLLKLPDRGNTRWETYLVGDFPAFTRGLIIVCNNAAIAVFQAKSFVEATNHIQDDDPFIEVLLIRGISSYSRLDNFYVIPEPADKERLSSLTYQLLLHREDNMKHDARKEILDYIERYHEPNGPQKRLEDEVEMLDYLNEMGYPPHPWVY